MKRLYPEGFVNRLITSNLVTPATRDALMARLDVQYQGNHRVLSETEFTSLRAIANRLIPQHDNSHQVDIADDIDARLARNDSKGWRYAALPPEAEMYGAGLRAVDATCVRQFGVRFDVLSDGMKDEILAQVQNGRVDPGDWQTLDPKLFFEEMLAEMVECYFSHPAAMEEIGYAGFADAAGWQQLGLDNLAPHEPRPL